jgi:predicted nucleic acid-binding protein
LQNPERLREWRSVSGLGLGEVSTVLLALELQADLALIDELRGRRLAEAKGLLVRGTVGILEAAYREGVLLDLRQSYLDLLRDGFYVGKASAS